MERHERSSAPRFPHLPARARVGALVLALLVGLVTDRGTAQGPADHGGTRNWHGQGEAAVLALNAGLGGATAGLWQELSGGSCRDGFVGGALGGTVAFAGKRLAAESFPGAGFLGRQVGATGTSIVRNASDGRALLDSLRLAVGPLRVYVSPRDPARPRLEADLHELYWTTHGLASGRFALDAWESLSSGTAVFRSDRPLHDADRRPIRGATLGGAVFLGPLDAEAAGRTLAHERGHVLQLDFLYGAWFRPLEDHLARRLPRRGLVDRVDYDVLFLSLQWSSDVVGWRDLLHAPLEWEGEFLERR